MVKNFISSPRFKSKWSLVATLIGLPILVSGCLNNFDTPPTQPAAYISIYQGSPDAPAMDIFANQNRVNNQPLNFAEVLAYSPFYVGERSFRFSSFNSTTTLLQKDFTIEQDAIYSMFVLDKVADLDAILIEDEWTLPSADSAQVRMVHLSPDTGEVFLQFSNLSTPVTNNMNFGDDSNFTMVKKNTYNVQVKSVATGDVLLSANDVQINGNRVYTFVLRGLAETTNQTQKMDLQLITNYVNF
ncbi:DUF4397 domain-containing protein [Algoriphagus sp. NBT04N3]|uniref:DUF4397 domain-containing protein n=1 Tax=Algoriphagus sp. NBT04N3 TaxID=2705473 RepID=UPI001C626F10|nr:DUF4397 domain-containing protein [Algoriphagus sp. NBT04N3]QYH38105.1 DUF4397 domain-containing protein [Algoriphagus sp. NBT04N3]